MAQSGTGGGHPRCRQQSLHPPNALSFRSCAPRAPRACAARSCAAWHDPGAGAAACAPHHGPGSRGPKKVPRAEKSRARPQGRARVSGSRARYRVGKENGPLRHLKTPPPLPGLSFTLSYPSIAGRDSSYPSGAGRSLRSLGFRATGRAARSRRPGLAARCFFHIPQAPGARSARLAFAPLGARRGRAVRAWRPGASSISLRRRALAPLAWLSRHWARGAVAPSGPGGPVLLPYPSGAGRSLRSLGFRATGRAARSRRPGLAARCFFHIPQAPGARSARLAFAPLGARRGRAVRAWRPGASSISLRRRALASRACARGCISRAGACGRMASVGLTAPAACLSCAPSGRGPNRARPAAEQ